MFVGKIPDLTGLRNDTLVQVLRKIINAVDGNLALGDNLQAAVFENFLFGKSANVYTFKHNLGVIPTKFLILNKDNFGDFKKGNVTWTPVSASLQCSIDGVRATVAFLP